MFCEIKGLLQLFIFITHTHNYKDNAFTCVVAKILYRTTVGQGSVRRLPASAYSIC